MDNKTPSKHNDTDDRNIGNLCLMCGQCCQAIATEFSHEELIEMAKKDEKEAKVFIDFFKKYENIAEVRKLNPAHVEQVLSQKRLPLDSSGNEVSFYYCDKILPDKRCSVHMDRPICCRMAPKNGWSLMPPKCGYAGWQYEERERLKGIIRSMRETVYEIETLEGSDAFVEELNMSLTEVKEYISKKALPFKTYGSAGW